MFCQHPAPMSQRRCGKPAERFFIPTYRGTRSGSPSPEALCEEHGKLYDQVFVRAGVAVEITLASYLLRMVHES
jgi:hypothetical protein